MSYVDIKTRISSTLIIETPATEVFIIGETYPLQFDGQPEIDGDWKVVNIIPSKSVELERNKTKVYSDWMPGITRIDYNKKAP